jgi:hypothetical protein
VKNKLSYKENNVLRITGLFTRLSCAGDAALTAARDKVLLDNSAARANFIGEHSRANPEYAALKEKISYILFKDKLEYVI